MNSNILFNEERIFKFDSEKKKQLIEMAEISPRKTSRICLHKSQTDTTQSMIICILPWKEFERHHHRESSIESYTIIEGELYVEIFPNGVSKKSKILKLTRDNTPYVHRGSLIHRPFTKEVRCIYHEVFHGSFEKERDVIYI